MPQEVNSALALPPQPARHQTVPLALGVVTLLLVAVRLAADGWRQPALWLTGLVLGVALYHASFGLSSAYRRMLVARDMRGMQAQLLLLALTTLCFAPVFASGTAIGQAVGGAWAPVGVSVAAGAFLFGIGMQIAGGCGSGTLYTAGGGSLRMLLAGHPWSITWGFTLWGAKAAQWLGWQATPGDFWQGDFQSGALAGGVLDDTTSMMDLAIVLGALCAASLAGRFAPRWDFPWRSLLAALLGGLLLGYGARIAYGCNIGAFVSGVASGSLHGWLWFAAALPGCWLGIRLRRRLGLAD